MNVFSAMEIAASGLNAERTRMNVIASNLANARTTQTPEGTPYYRQEAVFRAVPAAERLNELRNDPNARSAFMVEVPRIEQITPEEAERNVIYDPSHPDADGEGYVEMPNVNVIAEMVNMITASRAYEAGVTVVKSVKGMARSALSIGS